MGLKEDGSVMVRGSRKIVPGEGWLGIRDGEKVTGFDWTLHKKFPEMIEGSPG